MPAVNDKIWQALKAHQQKLSSARMTTLFEADPDRAERYEIRACGLLLDYSKNLVTDETLNLFSRLIDANSLPRHIHEMFEGAVVNVSENRPALHTLLRYRDRKHVPENLHDQARRVEDVLARMSEIANDVQRKSWTGHSGKPIRQVVHIGIGGSYLGPRVVAEALTPYHRKQIHCHYIANVDGHHIDHVLSRLDQDETLLITASKSFTTLETMVNARTARAWLLEKVPEGDLHRHQIAVTANTRAAREYGVAQENILPMWDWVGGRYSVWSAVGLPIAITHGFKTFRALLDGAANMDQHFKDAPWPDNMPMMLAMLGIWYHNFFDVATHAVLPYDHWLRLLPAHLQQLDMESNGKSVTGWGLPVDFRTGPVVWGGEGTNGQHAFHQLLHQGTQTVSTDFILPLTPHHDLPEHHDHLVANCLAQAQALMQGRRLEDITGERNARPHRVMPGNRPSNMILMDKLTPEALGALVALYEHKVFCQAMIWHINPFDQWGVELGKELGDSLYADITNRESTASTGAPGTDPSTQKLVRYYKAKLKT